MVIPFKWRFNSNRNRRRRQVGGRHMEITTEWAREVYKDRRSSGFTVEDIISWSKEWEKVRNELLGNMKGAK